MTLLVELDKAQAIKGGKSGQGLLLTAIYAKLPSSAYLVKYITKSVAYSWDLNRMDKTALMRMPKEFFVDVLLALSPGKHSTVSYDLAAALDKSCNFHEHEGSREKRACYESWQRDGAFFTSFVRACLKEAEEIGKLRKSRE